MKKFTKALVLLLTIALVCTGLILAASADEAKADTVSYVSQGNAEEGTLADAIANADASTTVTLLGDCTVSGEIAVTKTVTVDLNGYTLTTACATAFNVQSGEAAFNITGTGNITSAGTLVKATADGAKINVIGTGIDGITVEHTGTVEKNRLISLQSNTLNVTNVNINSHSGARVTAADGKSREYTIANTGTSAMTFKNVKAVSDVSNLGFGENGYFFFNLDAASTLIIEDSSFYTLNNFLRMTDSREGSVVIKNSVISANDTGSDVIKNEDGKIVSNRLAVVFANAGEVSGTVDIHDSVVEGSGRMFAYEASGSTYANITINSYGSTFKILEAEADLATKKSGGAYLQFKMNEFNLYNSEAGNPSRIIAVSLNINNTSPTLYALEPGVRVNFETITTATDTLTGIKVPKTIDENGKVTEWTYAASSADDKWVWVYDPIGDIDAPFVLVDTTKTTVSSANYYTNTSFDGIRPGVTKDKTLSSEGVAKTLNQNQEAENFKTYMHLSIGRGSLRAGYETGNAYLKYVVTPYNETLYAKKDAEGTVMTDDDGNTLYYTPKDFYDSGTDGYKGVTRNFNKEKEKDGGAAADPFVITGKNNDATFIAENSFTNNKVLINEFDFGCDSEYGFPAIGIVLQSRNSGTDVADSSYRLNVNNAGQITSNTFIDAPANAITQFNKNEWYRLSAVCFPETCEIYVFINGVYMGKVNALKSGVTATDNTYFQGFRINVYKSSEHKVNSSFSMDNVSVRSYTNYQYGETAVSAEAALKYITTSSPRKYMNDALTVNGRPMADMSVAADNADGSKVDVNANINLGNVTENVTVDFGGNTKTFGTDSYGYVADGTKYTFNENYWYNAYKYTGDVSKLTDGTYDESDFALVGKVKLGYNFDVDNYYTERVANFANYTVNTQNGWVYDIAGTDSVLPKSPDLSDLALADESKNVYYLPLLEAVPMTYVVKDTAGDIISYGIDNDETNNAFRNPVSGTTIVLLSDFTVTGGSDNYIRLYNEDPIVTADGVTTVNGVVIDNDYTEEEIATMREVAKDYKIDLNGNNLDMNKYRLLIGQNVEFSLYSSVPGAEVNMIYKDGTKMVGSRAFNMLYVNPANATKWSETNAEMLKTMNSRYNFGTYTDRNGNLVESEMISMTGAVIFEAATGDASCSFNINNVLATRAAATSWSTVVARAFNGKINVENSIFATLDTGDSGYAVHLVSKSDAIYYPEIVFDSCLFLNNLTAKSAVKNAGYSEDESKNIIFRNCISNARLNAAELKHVYFDEGTASEFMLVESQYATEGIVEAYCWEPMTVGGFADGDNYFVKIRKPVYSNGAINYDNYIYFVNNGYGEAFESAYPGVAYLELPLLTTKIVKETDAVKATFNKLDGTVDKEVYYVKGADVKAYTSDSNKLKEITISDTTYSANAVTLTYIGWGTLPTNVQEDVVIKPTYTVAANVTGLKANLSLYADFNVNLYIPATYADYAVISIGGDTINTTSATVNGVDYLMATVSQKCNMAGDNIVFVINVAEEIDGNLCEAQAQATISIASYANAILAGESFTDADKVLMYYMLNYANEAEKYIDTEADSTVTDLLTTYAAYGEKYNVNYTYDKNCNTSSLSPVFDNATLDIESTPAFVFTLKDGFEGTVTVSYSNGVNVRTYEVEADGDRALVVSGMKVYNFGTIITITANGTVNGEEVSVEGTYTLDTFAKYHSDNAIDEESETKEASEACMPLIKALFAYSEVAELYKTNALADALVAEAE